MDEKSSMEHAVISTTPPQGAKAIPEEQLRVPLVDLQLKPRNSETDPYGVVSPFVCVNAPAGRAVPHKDPPTTDTNGHSAHEWVDDVNSIAAAPPAEAIDPLALSAKEESEIQIALSMAQAEQGEGGPLDILTWRSQVGNDTFARLWQRAKLLLNGAALEKVEEFLDRLARLPQPLRLEMLSGVHNEHEELDMPTDDQPCEQGPLAPEAKATLALLGVSMPSDPSDQEDTEPGPRKRSDTVVTAKPTDMPIGPPTEPYAADTVSAQGKEAVRAKVQDALQKQRAAEDEHKHADLPTAGDAAQPAVQELPKSQEGNASLTNGIPIEPGLEDTHLAVPVVPTVGHDIVLTSEDPDVVFFPGERLAVAQIMSSLGLSQVDSVRRLWDRDEVPEDSLGGTMLSSFYQALEAKNPALYQKFVAWVHLRLKNRDAAHPKADTKPAMRPVVLATDSTAPLEDAIDRAHRKKASQSQTNLAINGTGGERSSKKEDSAKTDEVIVRGDTKEVPAWLAYTIIAAAGVATFILDRLII